MYAIIVKDLENGTEQEYSCDGYLLGVSTQINDVDVEIGTTISNLSVVEVEHILNESVKELDKFNQANQWLNEENDENIS